MTVDALDTRLERDLRERGLRVTPQRLLMHRALRELDRHVTAEELLAEVSKHLPNASLPTVYATLELFEELGIVHRVPTSGGPALYDPRTHAHHHLQCRSCGKVEDLDTPVDAAPVIRAAIRRGFRPDGAELVLSGLCARCASSRGSGA
ncbi:MAG TPA: Fur family transcriptional regulator [Thermoleophilaceae bacterium]|jgi:Fe2+ or Zn2+ uptake regulation protein